MTEVVEKMIIGLQSLAFRKHFCSYFAGNRGSVQRVTHSVLRTISSVYINLDEIIHNKLT